MSSARFVVGIDLGTTNSAVAFAEPGRSLEIGVFPIPQLVAEGEVAPRRTLPSAIYLAGEHDVPLGALALPWAEDRRLAVGVFAQKLGARVGGRLVTSAKSWLCHGGVDRTAAILPWGAPEDVRRISPVQASTLVLEHIRDAWDAAHPEARLADQDVVLTVPASFDEVARELTLAAAHAAGLRVRLLEEPQAAVYAWIASHAGWRDELRGRENLLIVDVGGGTTDFSAVAISRTAEGVGLERIAVGEHILLGGDNVDLALAHRLSAAARGGGALDAVRWQQLTALSREAKERLLGEEPPPQVEISLAGRGRGVIRDTVRATLTRDETVAVVRDGFFPRVPLEVPLREEGGQGLKEFGLPFAAEPEITRHLAEFVRRFALRVDAVLFNGGALKPRTVRDRLVELLAEWHGEPPLELADRDLEIAVARGAAAYGLARRGHLVRIAGGAARAYYIGLAEVESASEVTRVLCVAPRGMEEGTRTEIDEPEFEVTTNTPVRFPIYASATRAADAAGELIEVAPGTLSPLPPLSTVLRFGKRLEERRVPVRLSVALTETGTLELWCASRQTDHRWRLRFELRGVAERDSGDEAEASAASSGSQEAVVPESRIAAARERIAACFAGSDQDPVTLTRGLEETLGIGRDAWPITCIRPLWDALFEHEASRGRTPAHEARWLNLAGFLLRPGFGEERDPWRMALLWRLFERGPASPGAAQVRAEWWNAWKRVAGGLERAQQQALYQEIRPLLLPMTRRKAKPSRWKGGPQELREMWQVAGSLELLASGVKAEAAGVLVPRLAKGKANDAEVWALGRLGARSLVHGPANAVIPPATVAPWVQQILDSPWDRGGPTALALAQMARRTGDRARDLDEGLREKVARRLEAAGESQHLARWVREVTEIDAREQALVLAESLPAGLRIAAPDNRRES